MNLKSNLGSVLVVLNDTPLMSHISASSSFSSKTSTVKTHPRSLSPDPRDWISKCTLNSSTPARPSVGETTTSFFRILRSVRVSLAGGSLTLTVRHSLRLKIAAPFKIVTSQQNYTYCPTFKFS